MTIGVLRRHRYDAYGVVLSEEIYNTGAGGLVDSQVTSGLKYKGQTFDAETGQVYLRNRYYEPETGQFTQVDPARAGENWFAYTTDPINRYDPSGLDWEWIEQPMHPNGGYWKHIPGTTLIADPPPGFTPAHLGPSSDGIFRISDVPTAIAYLRARAGYNATLTQDAISVAQEYLAAANNLIDRGAQATDQIESAAFWRDVATRADIEVELFGKLAENYEDYLQQFGALRADAINAAERIDDTFGTINTVYTAGWAAINLPFILHGGAILAAGQSTTRQLLIFGVTADIGGSLANTAVSGEFVPGVLFRAGEELGGTPGGITVELYAAALTGNPSMLTRHLKAPQGMFLEATLTTRLNAPTLHQGLKAEALTKGQSFVFRGTTEGFAGRFPGGPTSLTANPATGSAFSSLAGTVGGTEGSLLVIPTRALSGRFVSPNVLAAGERELAVSLSAADLEAMATAKIPTSTASRILNEMRISVPGRRVNLDSFNLTLEEIPTMTGRQVEDFVRRAFSLSPLPVR